MRVKKKKQQKIQTCVNSFPAECSFSSSPTQSGTLTNTDRLLHSGFRACPSLLLHYINNLSPSALKFVKDFQSQSCWLTTCHVRVWTMCARWLVECRKHCTQAYPWSHSQTMFHKHLPAGVTVTRATAQEYFVVLYQLFLLALLGNWTL